LLRKGWGVQNQVHFQEPRTYRGRRAGRQGFAAEDISRKAGNALNFSFCAYSDRKTGATPDQVEGMLLRNTRVRGKAGFRGRSGAQNHHIIGAFPADIMVPALACARWGGFAQKRVDPLLAGYFCLNDYSIAPS
jgi:hypothetical protein